MHNGFPCTDMYPNEYFEDGITNGAKWYNVPGKPAFFALLSSRSHFIQIVPNQCLLTLTFLSGDAKNLLLLLVLLAALFRKYVVKNKFRKSALCDVTKESKHFLGFTLALPVHILFHLSEADLVAPKHVEGLAKKITFGRKQKLIVFARDCQQGVK